MFYTVILSMRALQSLFRGSNRLCRVEAITALNWYNQSFSPNIERGVL